MNLCLLYDGLYCFVESIERSSQLVTGFVGQMGINALG
jgi:hypothetical protein